MSKLKIETNEQIIVIHNSRLAKRIGSYYEISSETDSNRLSLNKEAISDDLFKLSTRIVEGILQKFINYNIKFAISGVFLSYTNKPQRISLCYTVDSSYYSCSAGNLLSHAIHTVSPISD